MIEPILLAGVSRPAGGFRCPVLGLDARSRIKIGGAPSGIVTVDAISGATITMMVINQTITKTLQQVAAAHGLLDGGSGCRAATGSFGEAIWRLVWAETQAIGGADHGPSYC